MNDVTKLPKWAQQELARVNANLSSLQKQYDALLGQTKTNIMIGGPYTPKGYLVDREEVAYRVNEQDHISVYYRENIVYLNGSGTLYIKPSATNCCYVGVEK